MKKRRKKYWNMTMDELAEVTKEFDREGAAETFDPLTPQAEAAWRRARRKRPEHQRLQGRGV